MKVAYLGGYSLYRYIINLVEVSSDKDELSIFRISKTPMDFGFTRIVHVINNYSQSLISTSLSSEYRGLKPGIYVSSVGRGVDKDILRSELLNAFEKYFQELNQRNSTHQPAQSPSPNINDIVSTLLGSIEEETVPSTAYVVANLLSNLIDKIIPAGYKCNLKVATRFCLQFSKKMLEGLVLRSENPFEPLFDFCQEHKNMCGEGDDGCAKFFEVVKQYYVRFQHGVVDDKDKVYMIFYTAYRRLSKLKLREIIEFLINNNGLTLEELNKQLKDVRVNVTIDRSSVLCKITNVKKADGSDMIIEMLCSDDVEKEKLIQLKLQELNSVRLNPTYKRSRDFIYHNLCKDFDKHKDLSQITPAQYFQILENDLKVFKLILAKFAPRGLCLGGAIYTIKDYFVRLGSR
jgi:hypothetical protein